MCVPPCSPSTYSRYTQAGRTCTYQRHVDEVARAVRRSLRRGWRESPGIVLGGRLVAGEDGIEPLQRVPVEPEIDGSGRPVKLVASARADDRPGNPVLVQQPCQGDGGRLFAEFLAEKLV